MSTQTTEPTEARGIPLGRPLGIPVRLSPSWLLIGLFVTVSLAPRAQRDLPGLSVEASYVVGAAAAVLLAVSVLAHELGHATVSLALGIPIRRITLFLLGGLAEISREPENAAREYLIAIAGPLVSLFLAAVGWAGALTLDDGVVRFLLLDLAVSNSVLAVFNLLPGLPLDGGRVLRAAVWQVTGDQVRATKVAVVAGSVIAAGLIGLGLVEVVALGSPGGLFLILIGTFIWSSGRAGLRRTRMTARVPALTVRALAHPTVAVPGDMPLAEALRRAQETGRRPLVVDAYGRPDGVVSVAAVEAVPAARRPWIRVAEVCRRLEPGLVLRADLVGEEVLAALRATPATEYLVVDDRGVVGVLATIDVVRQVSNGYVPEPAG